MTARTIVLLGPTAVGKTDLSLEIAEELGGEIVNADSMQLYRGMDIGTAKLPVAQRRGLPHHLLDVLDVTQEASVAVYQRLARDAVRDIHGRGAVAVVVGGSGLFISALLDDLRFPGSDPSLRARLMQEAEQNGTASLYQRLAGLAPTAAAGILPSNTRRVVRALEVLELTGQPPQTRLGVLPAVVPSVRIGIQRPRTELDQRISDRVTGMWQAGFVAEVRQLLVEGLATGPTASRALGYRQVITALNTGDALDLAQADTVAATRRFARRQQSWFKRDPRITWIDGSADLSVQCAAVLQLAAAA